MADPQDKPFTPAPIPLPEVGGGMTVTEVTAAALSVVWVAAVVGYVVGSPRNSGEGVLGLVMTLLVVFLPLALIWVTLSTLRSVRALRQEAGRLQAAVDAMRNAYVLSQQQGAAGGILKPALDRKLDEIAAAQRQTETVLASFSTRRDLALTVPSADHKAALAAPRPALPGEDQPAQDVLTLLSQEGIYMDDLKPDRARPEIWRRFAAGERGRALAGLGGIRDRSSLALTAGRMREDPVFRDAAHHFMRTFDKTFAEFAPNASDAELADLAETRTARAFMLFGRVTGTFD